MHRSVMGSVEEAADETKPFGLDLAQDRKDRSRAAGTGSKADV